MVPVILMGKLPTRFTLPKPCLVDGVGSRGTLAYAGLVCAGLTPCMVLAPPAHTHRKWCFFHVQLCRLCIVAGGNSCTEEIRMHEQGMTDIELCEGIQTALCWHSGDCSDADVQVNPRSARAWHGLVSHDWHYLYCATVPLSLLSRPMS